MQTPFTSVGLVSGTSLRMGLTSAGIDRNDCGEDIMTVKELIEALKKCNPENEVYYCTDDSIMDVVEHLDRIKPDRSNVTIY